MAAALRIGAALKSDPSWQALAQETADAAAHSPRTGWLPQWITRPVLAAGAVLVLGMLILAPRLGSLSSVSEERFVNDGVERRELRLTDGSRVSLDVGAELTARIGKHARRVRLMAGRAYFEVAHDASRPFTVDAAGVRTTALGTEFEVRLRGTQVNVTLAEGSVEVTAAEVDHGWSRRLVPGQQLQGASMRDEPRLRQVDVQRVVGWSVGQLRYEGTPLQEVVEEWNRYARVRVVLADPTLGEIRVGGTFRAGGDSNELVAALTMALPVHAVSAGPAEILLVRDSGE